MTGRFGTDELWLACMAFGPFIVVGFAVIIASLWSA